MNELYLVVTLLLLGHASSPARADDNGQSSDTPLKIVKRAWPSFGRSTSNAGANADAAVAAASSAPTDSAPAAGGGWSLGLGSIKNLGSAAYNMVPSMPSMPSIPSIRKPALDSAASAPEVPSEKHHPALTKSPSLLSRLPSIGSGSAKPVIETVAPEPVAAQPSMLSKVSSSLGSMNPLGMLKRQPSIKSEPKEEWIAPFAGEDEVPSKKDIKVKADHEPHIVHVKPQVTSSKVHVPAVSASKSEDVAPNKGSIFSRISMPSLASLPSSIPFMGTKTTAADNSGEDKHKHAPPPPPPMPSAPAAAAGGGILSKILTRKPSIKDRSREKAHQDEEEWIAPFAGEYSLPREQRPGAGTPKKKPVPTEHNSHPSAQAAAVQKPGFLQGIKNMFVKPTAAQPGHQAHATSSAAAPGKVAQIKGFLAGLLTGKNKAPATA